MAIIDGTSDPELLVGTADDDQISGFESDDFLRGLGGNDSLYGGTENDELGGGEGNDLIDGGDGIDRATFYDYTQTITTGCTVSLLLQGVAQDTGHGLDTLIGIEHLSGTQFSDVLTGDVGDNWLWGQSQDFNGTRTANGDTLTGGNGDDLMTVGSGDNILSGGRGVDTVSVFDANGNVTLSLTLQGAAQDTTQGMMTLTKVESLSGSDFDDSLTGDNKDNILLGAAGDDTLTGGRGADSLYGDGLMSIDGIGYSGAIRIFADAGEDATDHDGNPAIGDDSLYGGNGDDFLYGAGGADYLEGGKGHDTFVFRAVTDSAPGNEDLISDFRNQDHIDLSGIDAVSSTEEDDPFHFADAFTGEAGQLTIHPLGGGSHYIVLEGDVNGDGAADFRLYYLQGPHIDPSNFIL